MGCSLPHLDSSSITNMCHRFAIRELPPLTPSDAIKVLESDFKDSSTDSKMPSQDDPVPEYFIQKTLCGHYEMPLPFKRRPYLPDNKQLAIVRLGHLKRKLLKDEI